MHQLFTFRHLLQLQLSWRQWKLNWILTWIYLRATFYMQQQLLSQILNIMVYFLFWGSRENKKVDVIVYISQEVNCRWNGFVDGFDSKFDYHISASPICETTSIVALLLRWQVVVPMQLTAHVPAPLSYWLLTQLASVATDDIAMGVALGSEGRENLPSATSDIWTNLLLLLVAFFLREWRQKNLRNINECFRISFLELSSATKKNYWRVHTFRCVAWFHCQVILGLGYNLFFLYIYIYFFGRGENAASGFVLNTCLPHNPKMSRVVQKLEGYKFRSGSSFSN